MYLVEYYKDYNNRLYHPLGTDYTMIVKDLKTLQGVISRAKKYAPCDTIYYQIIYTTNIYDVKTYITKHRELINTEWEGI